jgi:uncharacterized metal-binding protein
MGRTKTRIPADCASCKLEGAKKACMTREGVGVAGCPTLTQKKLLNRSNREYEPPDIKEFARQASVQEGECYANRYQRPYVMQPTKTRMEEIAEFSRKMKYSRLGLAFCIGLAREAAVVEEIFRTKGFEVISILCKAGRTPKEQIGIKDQEKIFQGTEESMCNPIFQAKLLNEEKTDFNILLGLCVGHDSLFFQYAKAPTTVLAVKDRVTGHNPLVPIYLSVSYYQKLRHSEIS